MYKYLHGRIVHFVVVTGLMFGFNMHERARGERRGDRERKRQRDRERKGGSSR